MVKARLACVSRLGQDREVRLSAFPFPPSFLLALVAWLAMYPPCKSCKEVTFGFMHRLGKSWSSNFRRSTKRIVSIWQFQGPLFTWSEMFECLAFSYTNVSCQIVRCQRNLNAYIACSALTCSTLAMVTFLMLQYGIRRMPFIRVIRPFRQIRI